MIPNEIDEVFMIRHVATGATTSILTETGAWNVLTVLSTTHLPEEHQLSRIPLG